MKLCNKCKIEKELEDFVPIYSRPGKYRSVCKVCHRLDSIKHRSKNRKKRRDFLNQLKDKPCSDCGVKYPPYVMDFDHKGDKSFNIADAIWSMSQQAILDEIQKCEVVCANCHRQRTHKQ